MKIRHRIPPEAHFRSDPVTPEYQAEVDRATAKSERRAAYAELRLQAAQAKLENALRIKKKAQRERAVMVALELVEVRRQELLQIQRQMTQSPAAAANRGNGHGKRPVPGMQQL